MSRRSARVYKVVDSQQDLQALTDFWLSKLRLTEWEVVAKFASKDELEGSLADIGYEPLPRTAILRVVRPTDWECGPEFDQDMEELVVHELYHLRMRPFDKFVPSEDSPENEALEVIIAKTTQSIISLARSTPSMFYRGLKLSKPSRANPSV